MNQTSATSATGATSQSGASLLPDGIGALTAVHFVILALIAIGVIAMIVAGIRRKRIRHQAAREMTDHAEQAGVAPPGQDPVTAQNPVAAQGAVAAPASPPAARAASSLAAPAAPAAPAPIASPANDPAREPAPLDPEPLDPSPIPLDDEPIAAAAPMEASPASEAAPQAAPAPASAASADAPVTLLKGLGPKVAAALADRGIVTVGQIAALDEAQAAALDADLGSFRGRMTRDRWIEQARFLAAGDRAGFETVFGKL